MAKPDTNNQVLDKKTIEKYRKELIDDFNNNYKESIAKDLANDVKDSFTEEYKENLKDELTEEIKDEVKERIAKEEKKLSRAKSFKIFRFSIYILILLAIVIYVFYRLYVNNSLDLIKYDYVLTSTTNNTSIITENSTTTTQITHDLNWYKNTYSYLLNNIHITNYNLLKGEYDISTLDMKEKLSLAFMTLQSNQINSDGSITTIPENNLKNAYLNLFGTNDYKPTDFNINENSFAYSENNNLYMSISYKAPTDTIVYSIDNITDSDDVVFNLTIGVVKDNKLYNINDLDNPVGDYNNNISDYTNLLTKETITFKRIDSTYYISKLSNN